jgi:hypothetical protein
MFGKKTQTPFTAREFRAGLDQLIGDAEARRVPFHAILEHLEQATIIIRGRQLARVNLSVTPNNVVIGG